MCEMFGSHTTDVLMQAHFAPYFSKGSLSYETYADMCEALLNVVPDEGTLLARWGFVLMNLNQDDVICELDLQAYKTYYLENEPTMIKQKAIADEIRNDMTLIRKHLFEKFARDKAKEMPHLVKIVGFTHYLKLINDKEQARKLIEKQA